ncbi:MAG: hypothetical protein V2A76_08865 [Planctomycetota bacterium]
MTRILRFSVLAASLALTRLAAAQQASDNPNLNLAPDEIRMNLVKILRTSNKAQTNRYVPKVYEFEHVNPYAVIRFIRRAMEIEDSLWFSFANPDMDGGRLLLVCPEYQIAGLDALVEVLDREDLTSSAGGLKLLYRLRHQNAFDPGLLDVCRSAGTTGVVVQPDNQINSLLLSDTPAGSEQVQRALLEVYDVPTPQMEARITVYEVDLTADGQIGLDYVAWKSGPGRNLGSLGLFAQKEKISTLNAPSALLYHSGKNTHQLPGRALESTGRNGAYFLDMPSAYFDFLAAEGRARVATRAKMVALNRSTSLLEVGEEILYYRERHEPDLRTGSRLMPLDPYGDLEALTDTPLPGETTDDFGSRLADHPDGRTVTPALEGRSLGAASTGLFIQFTPTISTQGCTVNFALSIVEHTGYADDGTPVLASRSQEQSFEIPHDGREITLSGLVRKRRSDSSNKIPWLGDLPVLGYLLGGESHLDQQSMVVTTFSARVLEFGTGNTSDEDARIQEEVDE